MYTCIRVYTSVVCMFFALLIMISPVYYVFMSSIDRYFMFAKSRDAILVKT